jgi:multidrug efflux pump subunit AcrB
MTGHHRSDDELIAETANTARFFTKNTHLAWVLLVGTLIWGVYAYLMMPKRKDPNFPVLFAAVVCPWPGASAERIEQYVTRRIEEAIAQNEYVERIESVSRTNVSITFIALDERTPKAETGRAFDDIAYRVGAIRDFPPGAGPLTFEKDFGETAALLLTIASPKVNDVDLSLRAAAVRDGMATARAGAAGERVTLVVAFPESVSMAVARRERDLVGEYLGRIGAVNDPRPVDGTGFVGIDVVATVDDDVLLAELSEALQNNLVPSDFHPDVWLPTVIRDPADAEARLASVAGDRFSYRELDEFTALVKRAVQAVPQVSNVFRAGVLPEQIYLDYSQARLAASGLDVFQLAEILGARNVTMPGGMLAADGRSVAVDPSGEFESAQEIGEVMVASASGSRPQYLRDLVDISRAYQSPPQYLNFYTWRDEAGDWHRSRAITLAVQMRPGQQIGAFGAEVDRAIDTIRAQLPPDLVIARPSDQPLQVEENVSLFMRSLYEAIVLVVVVAFIGFWDWRSALLMAISIPLTLAMTFGLMHLLGIDLQQVSIASLIIALGLLVDDPVVAGDAIKRELRAGRPPSVAAWLGPTKLASAILYSTITIIVAYLPLLMVTGGTGNFIYSLPIVLACALIASRIVSMTFIPLLGQYLLRPGRSTDMTDDRRARGMAAVYYRWGGLAIDHRWRALGVFVLLLVAGAMLVGQLKVQFFPKDLSYLSYIDVWLPEDATIGSTDAAAARAEAIVRDVTDRYAESAEAESNGDDVLASLTTFVGGGGPRFWFSVSPELVQPNYAQIIVKVRDKRDTDLLVGPLQRALSAGVPGARVDVRQLETGKPVGIPVSIRVSGENVTELRRLALRVSEILRSVPIADRVRDDWGAESFKVRLEVDSDRANLAGVSNRDVGLASTMGINGMPLTHLRQRGEQIPVVARLRLEERARISDIENLYVYSLRGPQRVPQSQVSSVSYNMATEKIRRRNQFRTVTISAFPVPGALPSDVLNAARAELMAMAETMPTGYQLAIGGEEEEKVRGFGELAIVMAESIGAIFLTLVLQFRHAVKPLIVFSAMPFGIVGALAALRIMGAPFGFMAFLGVASLFGVIVSHVIVLFDFIEEARERGEPLRNALLDAGLVRLRPVVITVGATVLGLVPLALHGGPLWQGLCYTTIGGLLCATVITLVLVPVLYAIFVLDLKLVAWERA